MLGLRADSFTLAVVALVVGCGGEGTGGTAWSPGDTATSTSTTSRSSTGTESEDGRETGETSTTSTGGDEDCTLGPGRDCDDASTSDTMTGDSGAPASEVCYPGADGSYSTCFELVPFDTLPEGYTYPAPLNGQASYRQPIALIDLEGLDPATLLAPNFGLTEIAQSDQGRYAIIQPHAVESLQMLRDTLGSITVNSGYRSPSNDVGIEGAAPYSRHMYGDGFDLVPAAASLSELETACTDIGGFLIEYASHVHCDFRDDPLDEGFFGAASGSVSPKGVAGAARPFDADIVQDRGVLSTTWEGFDEGEPMQHWSAYDNHGALLLKATGATFVVPVDAASVTVLIGAQIEVSTDVRHRPRPAPAPRNASARR